MTKPTSLAWGQPRGQRDVGFSPSILWRKATKSFGPIRFLHSSQESRSHC
ncbi:unnamed protein product [Prunus brigantina]